MKSTHSFNPVFILLFIILPSLSIAQEKATENTSFNEYKGIVKDNNTGDVLVFADISVADTNIATITNNEGEFLIKIPKELNTTELIISHLGFKNEVVDLNSIKNPLNIKVKLSPQITELNEISIHSIKDAKSIVKRMLKKSGNNYLNERSSMTAFYRETIKKRKKNASLSEAVVEIYKEPYVSLRNDKINLIKARKKINYSRLDTLAVKLQGGPFSTLYSDFIKYREFVFTESDLDDYDFTLESLSKINSNEVFVISFKPREDIEQPLYYGKLYIDVQSTALVSAMYSLDVSNKALASKMYLRKKPPRADVYPTKAAYRVDYKIKDGLWYYSYSNIALTFKVNWKHKLFNSIYSLNCEMAITDWDKGFNKSKANNLIRPTTILTEEVSGFSDPNFWGEYNIIEPEKSIESAIKKINRKLKQS